MAETHFSIIADIFKAVQNSTLIIPRFTEAIAELQEIDTLLTAISTTNSRLSKSDLDKIGSNSFVAASRYGKSAADYLSGVQEALRAGYEDAEGIAELSLAIQSASGMTAELADQMIAATDKAYNMNGSVAELTKVLDGMNHISSHNAVCMAEISEGMSIAGSTAAAFGVDVDQAAAALATMASTTQQSGSEAADAFRAILLNIRQVADEEEGIDAVSLAKYKDACTALNVALTETKNGVLSLRDPMAVLNDLAAAYNKLGETDTRRTDLLSAAGGDKTAVQLDALLSHWDTYEAMLQQYADGTGSLALEAARAADSWEGSLNRLSNTWTDTIGNIADSSAVVTAVNALNSLLSVVNNITDKLDSPVTAGIGAGLFAGLKNVGGDRRYSPVLF